jgi:tetratricopeptide (TPR) repeat protein
MNRPLECSPTTDGEIAVINLESARRRSWARFCADPSRDGVAETLVEQEQFTLQFVGDVSALDRVELLAAQLDQADLTSARVSLIQAQVASMAHRFCDARRYVSKAEITGAPAADIDRLRLTIDQACGDNLDNVLAVRRQIAAESQELGDFVALGSLLADFGDVAGADEAYKEALRTYRDVSPFPVAWVYFQLGVLWGELAMEPDLHGAAQWYRRAITILPMYTKARVHLAEIRASEANFGEAEALLRPVVAIGDPEVHWRLADVLAAQEKFQESEACMRAARSGFEVLLERHLLAFADHGAEFYADSGDDNHKALRLARINANNRPTLRALEQAYDIAISVDDRVAAFELLSVATQRWGQTFAFRVSSLQERRLMHREGAMA